MNTLEEFLSSDNYIVVNKTIIQKIGLHEAILICELLAERRYWRKENKLVDGEWFYSTRANLEENTGLSPTMQRSSINSLKNLEILETKQMGLPAKTYYRIVDGKMLSFLTARENETSQQEVRKSDSNSNNIKEINKETISSYEEIPETPVNSIQSSKRNFRTKQKTLSDSLGGLSDVEKEPVKKKRKSLYDKCRDTMDDTEFNFSADVKSHLLDYLSFILQGDEKKKIKGVGQWKGKLRALCKLSNDPSVQMDIIDQSINAGAYGFFQLNALPASYKKQKHDSPGIPDDDIIPQRLHGEEVKKELERREREVGVFL